MSECIEGYKRGHCIAVLAFVCVWFWSLRSWRDSCARETFLAAELPWEMNGFAARENPNWLQIDLYTHPSPGSAVETIQHSHAYPAS